MKKTLFIVGSLFAGSTAFAENVDLSFGTTNDVTSLRISATESIFTVSNAVIDVTTDKTPSVGGTYIAPNTNVQTAAPWKLTFDLTNNSEQEVTISSIALSAFSFSSGNAGQNFERHVDFTVMVGKETFEGGAGTTLATGLGITNVPTEGSYILGVGKTVEISITANGSAWSSTERGTFAGLTGGSISYTVTPEPTTATLSLLALAGLCARRRRK